jgi:hypothetical protein
MLQVRPFTADLDVVSPPSLAFPAHLCVLDLRLGIPVPLPGLGTQRGIAGARSPGRQLYGRRDLHLQLQVETVQMDH